MTHRITTILFLALAVLSFVPFSPAQQPPDVAAAPLPAQLLHAKRVFIVNAEGDSDQRIAKYVGGTNGIYNQFYADVKTSSRFEIADSPADADVVLSVTLTVFAVVPGYPRFRLSILDPKSNVLLWTISEPVDPAFLTKTARRNVAESLSRITADLIAIVPKS
jgi:hypothetical protein